MPNTEYQRDCTRVSSESSGIRSSSPWAPPPAATAPARNADDRFVTAGYSAGAADWVDRVARNYGLDVSRKPPPRSFHFRKTS